MFTKDGKKRGMSLVHFKNGTCNVFTDEQLKGLDVCVEEEQCTPPSSPAEPSTYDTDYYDTSFTSSLITPAAAGMDTTDDQTSLAFARSPKSKEDSLAQQKTGERAKSQCMKPPYGEVLKPSSPTMERIRMGEDNSYHLHKEDGTAVEKGTVGSSADAKAAQCVQRHLHEVQVSSPTSVQSQLRTSKARTNSS